MAHLKIHGYTWKRQETTTDQHLPDGSRDQQHEVIETVRARFGIIDGEPFVRATLSRSIRVLPELLAVTFESVNGREWGVAYGVKVAGRNIKKDGKLGAKQDVQWFDLPEWVKALYEPNQVDRSNALDWVRLEYPR